MMETITGKRGSDWLNQANIFHKLSFNQSVTIVSRLRGLMLAKDIVKLVVIIDMKLYTVYETCTDWFSKARYDSVIS